MSKTTIPRPKCEMAIDWFGENTRTIYFWATTDAVADIGKFGLLDEAAHPDQYSLKVDPRYDFIEVLEYIRNYG